MKKQAKTRILLILLSALLVLSVLGLSSCADPKKPEQPATQPTGTEGEDDDPDRLYPDLPDVEYDGAEIHVLEWSANGQEQVGESWIPWEDIAIEVYDAEILNKAVYNRNSKVEQDYKVKITKEYISVDFGFGDAVKNSVKTQDGLYQMITIRSLGIGPLVTEKYMVDMNSLKYLDFEKPWWNADSVRSYTLGDTLYFAAPELLLRDKGATACMYYNAKVANDFGIRDLYDLVKNNQWTQEKVADYASIVVHDENGDDVVDSMEDMWGAFDGDDTVYYLYNGTGMKFAEIDDSGYLQYNFGDDESVTAMKDIFDNIMYADWYANNAVRENFKDDLFKTDHCLFQFGQVKTVMGLRQMESDYGILPIPMYSDEQEDYSSLVWVHHDAVLGIPDTGSDSEMTSVILEALSSDSYYTVYPAFYENVISTKSTRDEQSKEMLEIVFRTRSFDPGQYWDDVSGLHGGDGFLRLSKKGTSDIAGIWAKYKTPVTTQINKINDMIDSLS